VVTSDLGALRETAGPFGRLVAPLASPEDRAAFVARYRAALVETLQQWRDNPSGFREQRFHQVEMTVAKSNWKELARQWEEKLPDWQRLANRPRSVRPSSAELPQRMATAAPADEQPWVRLVPSPGFSNWLSTNQASLAVTAPGVSKLFLIGMGASGKLS